MAFGTAYLARGRRGLLAGLGLVLALAFPAAGQSLLDRTVLAGAEVSKNSQTVSEISWGHAELSDGTEVPYRPWYSSGQQDLHLTMLTSLSETFGVLWGFGTGEQGVQYQIDPSLTLGFISSRQVGERATLSLRMSVVMGGYLSERPCTADYGAIGGVRQVNCRMSGSILRPEDTLDYLLDEAPEDQLAASLTYKLRF